MWIVFGAGLSGISACEWLVEQKQTPAIYDDRPIAPLKKTYLTSLGVRELTQVDFLALCQDHAPQIVVSPGVPYTHPLLTHARSHNCTLISDIDLALQNHTFDFICVTGTNGKSTAVKMIEHLLQQMGHPAIAAGNIGHPLTRVLTLKQKGIAVLELSSYQLAFSQPIPSRVACFYNFSEDHLEWHPSLTDYFASKWQIFRKSTHCLTSPAVAQKAKELKLPLPQGLKVLDDTDAPDFGVLSFNKHDQQNAHFACEAVAAFFSTSVYALIPLLKNYRGLPYRCEKSYFRGQLLINDSKSTNVDSTLAALASCEGEVILFMGGVHKPGSLFHQITAYRQKIKCVVLFGQARQLLFHEFKTLFPTQTFTTLREACSFYRSASPTPKTALLFSPGCASFDEFRNYSDRGKFIHTAFSDIVGV